MRLNYFAILRLFALSALVSHFGSVYGVPPLVVILFGALIGWFYPEKLLVSVEEEK